jgi:hypothetical protein
VLQGAAGWIIPQKVAVFPVLRRPNRPLHKPTAAVGASIALQNRLNAGGAKRAFEAADAGFEGIRWQRYIAVFAVGAEF